MASAWGKSWGSAWGNSWGAIETEEVGGNIGGSGVLGFIGPIVTMRMVFLQGAHYGWHEGHGDISTRASLSSAASNLSAVHSEFNFIASLESGDIKNGACIKSHFHGFHKPTERTQLNAALIMSFLMRGSK